MIEVALATASAVLVQVEQPKRLNGKLWTYCAKSAALVARASEKLLLCWTTAFKGTIARRVWVGPSPMSKARATALTFERASVFSLSDIEPDWSTIKTRSVTVAAQRPARLGGTVGTVVVGLPVVGLAAGVGIVCRRPTRLPGEWLVSSRSPRSLAWKLSRVPVQKRRDGCVGTV